MALGHNQNTGIKHWLKAPEADAPMVGAGISIYKESVPVTSL